MYSSLFVFYIQEGRSRGLDVLTYKAIDPSSKYSLAITKTLETMLISLSRIGLKSSTVNCSKITTYSV